MMTVPLAKGLCPEQWKKAIDVMLDNISGVVRSNKLRIIQLLEANLNFPRTARESSAIISTAGLTLPVLLHY
jgi:hypothetical protein